MKFVVIAVLVGVLSGLVAALCGVGGGIIMVPFSKDSCASLTNKP